MVQRAPGLGMLSGTRLAVWGDPIAHSRSPLLHAAAYDVLDARWTYDRRRVDETGFPSALSSLDASWRGLSLTMPLKSAAFRAAVAHDARARSTGAVNTLLLGPRGPRGYNTDVGGIVAALGEAGVGQVSSARILGAGATATSALVALSEMGVASVEILARRPDAADELVARGAELGMRTTARSLEGPHRAVEVTVATLPGDAVLPSATVSSLADAGGTLMDVVYGTWPTPLSAAWSDRGLTAVSGLPMLLHQALRQVRVFVGGEQDQPLDDEARVLAAMRRALVGE
ncbi:shikimate dehydrogenase [Microbacterium sp. CIAB417]|uniref:shikimate dehydrogenase n=1 Tax=Microbacterium sp. CIAB417 TaxID=2860287 RepID=UPI0027E22ECC|nr:shikimate dehydrogenase [Microbacterium sp. CIAB417]